MKKILSLFLTSMILLSICSGITVFAATSQATQDGGTLWYKWDFESSIKDTINNQATTALAPVMAVDSDAGNVGKLQWYEGATANISVFPSSAVNIAASDGDRYAVAEFDFKKDATTSSIYFRWRDTKANSNRGVFLWDKTSTNGWMHLVIVVDSTTKAVSVYSVEDGVYTELNNPTYPSVSTTIFGEFRIEIGKAADDIYYIDNLELKTYNNFYAAINAAQSAENVMSVIDRYVGIGLAAVPTEYNNLTSAKKLSVTQKLLNKNFASDSEVVSEISAILADEVFEKVYFDWNFEDGTINDSVNNEAFMSDYSVSELPLEIKATQDPTNADNNVAVMSDGFWANYAQILTYTDVIDNALAADEFDYLTFDFKVYGDQSNNIPVYLQIRDKSGSNKFYVHNASKAGRTWHQFKSIINIIDKTVTTYALENGVWNEVKHISLPSTFGFYRFEFIKAGTACTTYYDDFKITGYKSVVTEVNEASVNGVLAALETADSIGVISLPAAYASLDDTGKAAFATSMKSETYASAQEIQNDIVYYFSTDELVILSTANDADGKLDTVNLVIKKDGVSLASSTFIVASYLDGQLTGLKPCPQDLAVSNGSSVTLTGLGIDLENADSAKIMLIDGFTNLTPATKAVTLK